MMSTPLPPLPPPSAAQWLHPGSSPHPPGQVFFREPGWHSGSPSPKPAEHVFSIHRSSSDPEAPEAGGGSCTGGRGPGGCEPVSGGSTCSSPTAAVSPRSLRETHYCAVCSDLASGYHYGVWSCEGCKAFFKRSIQGKTNYICPATNQCTIDKNRRKSCQACRLRKCHEVGMVRDACRRDRRGGGGALRGPAGAAARNPAQNPPNHKRSCSETDSATGRPSPAPAAASPEAPECKRNPSEPPAVNQMLTSLMEAEPPKVLSLQESKQPFSEASLMNVLTNLADRELVHMIAWAKKIPGFMDINLEDQVQLLESCWLEVLMVGLIWRSMTHPGKLVFAADLVLERDDGCCVEGIVDIFDLLLRTASQFIELSVTLEEFICLKAMVLLNSSLFPVLPPPSAPPPTSISQPIPMLSGMGPAALATATATAAATDTTSPSVSAQATATAITTPHPADPCSMSIADVASTLPQMSPGQAVYSLEGRRSEQGSGSSSSSSSSEKVRRILDGVTDALAWHMAQSDIPVMERPRRLVCLLLLLSHIRFIGNKGIQHLYNIKRKNVVPLYDLLLEMLDANVLSEHSACSKISQATGTQDTGSGGGGGGGSQCKAMENSRNSVKSPALQSNDEPPSAKIRMTMGSEQPFDALG
nr:estrogen receptor beta-like isoform X2 [Petromyzon marinus]XP_032819691.1 estrogen receptor beta-like isoform X2 [Petromyzon marinus]